MASAPPILIEPKFLLTHPAAVSDYRCVVDADATAAIVERARGAVSQHHDDRSRNRGDLRSRVGRRGFGGGMPKAVRGVAGSSRIFKWIGSAAYDQL